MISLVYGNDNDDICDAGNKTIIRGLRNEDGNDNYNNHDDYNKK